MCCCISDRVPTDKCFKTIKIITIVMHCIILILFLFGVLFYGISTLEKFKNYEEEESIDFVEKYNKKRWSVFSIAYLFAMFVPLIGLILSSGFVCKTIKKISNKKLREDSEDSEDSEDNVCISISMVVIFIFLLMLSPSVYFLQVNTTNYEDIINDFSKTQMNEFEKNNQCDFCPEKNKYSFCKVPKTKTSNNQYYSSNNYRGNTKDIKQTQDNNQINNDKLSNDTLESESELELELESESDKSSKSSSESPLNDTNSNKYTEDCRNKLNSGMLWQQEFTCAFFVIFQCCG